MKSPDRSWSSGGLAVVLLLLGALAGCGGQSVVTEGDITLLVYNGSLLPQDGTDAQITGMVAVANGCVGLASESTPDQVRAVIWPSGTEIAEVEPLKLRLPSGVLVTEGTNVQGAGGYSDDATALEIEVPSSCGFDADQETAVFNPDDDPTVPD